MTDIYKLIMTLEKNFFSNLDIFTPLIKRLFYFKYEKKRCAKETGQFSVPKKISDLIFSLEMSRVHCESSIDLHKC